MAVSAADSLPAFAGVIDFRNRKSVKNVARPCCRQAASISASPVRSLWDGLPAANRGAPNGAGLACAAREGLMIAGDVRLDNRDALANDLSLNSEVSDSELVLAAWLRWGRNCLERLRGDYVFALWSIGREELELVRGPCSAGQIYYRSGPAWLAFASQAQPLANMSGMEKSLDFDSAARFIGGVPHPGNSTFFANVRRLEHSHSLQFDRNHIRTNQFWRPTRREARGRSDQDIADEFRALFDQAVRARIARGDGQVAAHLSAGRDSGAIVGAAAGILAQGGDPLLALTSAPRPDFDGSGLDGKLDDESVIAAGTAALYPNARHIVVRTAGSPFAGMSEAHALTPNPLAHPTNYQWGREILKRAAAAGATVLLTGDVGNFTVSGGGESHLAAVLREQGLVRWLERARSLVTRPVDLLRVVNWTFGGRVPLWVYRQVRRATGLQISAPAGLRLLREPFRSKITAMVLAEVGDPRPPANPFGFRAEILETHDPANLVGRALWGIDGRDPTTDRDLVDFCFEIPAHLLVRPQGGRPLYELAFQERLDPRQLRPRQRGYQGADWDLSFTSQAVAAQLDKSREHPYVRELIDLEYVDRLIASWPTRWPDPRTMLHYRNDLVGAVGVADYIAVNF